MSQYHCYSSFSRLNGLYMQHHIRASKRLHTIILGVAALASSAVFAQSTLNQAQQAEDKINQDAQSSQKKINRIVDQKDELLGQYRGVLSESENLRIYNKQLTKIVNNQRAEVASINRQLDQLESTNRGVMPMLLEMLDNLDKLVQADMPFDLEARQEKVEELIDMIDRSDVTTAEKYRRIMEAYQFEMQSGREFYEYYAIHPTSGKNVHFLAMGRAVLAYQSVDQSETGWFNPTNRQWEVLGDEYKLPVQTALRMASKQEAPNLVNLPVPAPVKAQ